MRSSVISLAVFGVVGLIGLILTFAMIGINNTCVTQEKSLVAQYKQNQNNYDNYFKKLKETAQVPDMYRDDLKSLYNTAMSGRYGSEGSKALFQWIKEVNPSIDATLYRQIQQVVEAGRNDFEVNQKMLLDKKRVYETYLEVFPNSLIVGFLGFPKITLADYDIITSEETEKIFNEKKSEVIVIR